jgi:hypothetical protein
MKFLDKTYTQQTLKLALPVMLTQVGQVSVNLFDNIIVGKLLGAQARFYHQLRNRDLTLGHPAVCPSAHLSYGSAERNYS